MRVLPFVVGAPLLAAVSALAVPARADSNDAEAERAFQRGVAFMKADNCVEAAPELRRSEALDPSAATLLNLATCYARLGKKATAWKTYRAAADRAELEKDDALHERAVLAMGVLGPTLTKVQIIAPTSAEPLAIRLNGEVLHDYDGLPIPLDPGESVIEAAAPGREPWRRSITADDLGATLVIQVPELQTLPPARAAPPLDVPRPNSERRIIGQIVAGAGLTAVVAGSILGLSASQTYDEAQHYCASGHCTTPGITLVDRADRRATAATWTIGVGVVAVAAGVVLWLTAPTETRRRAAIGYGPWFITSSGLGMTLETVR